TTGEPRGGGTASGSGGGGGGGSVCNDYHPSCPEAWMHKLKTVVKHGSANVFYAGADHGGGVAGAFAPVGGFCLWGTIAPDVGGGVTVARYASDGQLSWFQSVTGFGDRTYLLHDPSGNLAVLVTPWGWSAGERQQGPLLPEGAKGASFLVDLDDRGE